MKAPLLSLPGLAFVMLSGCCFPPADCEDFSFETGLQDWQAAGTDLEDPPVDWSIEQSEELASDGVRSVKLYLDNLNDAGKIWIVREFQLDPNALYQAHVRFDLASADFGSFNLWKVIVSVTSQLPQTRDDLTYPDDTANGSDADIGYQWLQKEFDFTAETDSTGRLYVSIGVWGTWETARIYYIDKVQVCFRRLW